MTFKFMERGIWLVVVAALVVGTVYITNYVRDHEVYRESAAKCSSDQTVLGQEIENLKAQLKEKDMDIDQLKEMPIR